MAERADPLVKYSELNDTQGRLTVEVEKEVATADELKILERIIVETENEELIDTTVTELISELMRKRDYLLHPEARGETHPTREVEYIQHEWINHQPVDSRQ